ncbi:MAG: type VI secretion protein, partial [Proteobacteria bacterium]|nr:type VI secretion protein [Pseudomonadota bacterium]
MAPMTPDRDPAELSPVYARAQAARPRVSQPSSPWTVVAGLAGAVALGVFVFSGLSHGRAAHAQPTPLKLADRPEPAWAGGLKTLLAQNTAQPPAPVIATPPPRAAILPPAPMTAAPPPDPSEANWKAPAVVVDLADNSTPTVTRVAQTGPAGAPVASAGAGDDNRLNADERFAARITNSGSETARATQMRDLSRIVPQGFVVPATLETAIDSDLPGSVRAVVSRDVRGFDGKQVLIPR